MKRNLINFFRKVLLLFAGVSAVACSKDDDGDAVLSFGVSAVYFSGAEQSQTIEFTARGVERLSVASRPAGWGDDNTVLDATNRTLTVVVPASAGDGTVASSGTITINGYTSGNKLKSASLFVGIASEKTLSGPANCFIASEKDTHYSFAPVRGDGSEVQPASVGLIWQSSTRLIQNLCLEEGRISFYVGADATHTDEVMRGNAVIGAYDAVGMLLWSWHVWTVAYTPEEDAVAWNGYELMGRNLGALDNSTETGEERLASYGLFYQWGRKDPFIGSSSYRANNGTSATIYDGDNKSTAIKFVEASAETGTEEYARLNPLSFVTGVKENGYDWLWEAASENWNKTNDPCPYGWRVAPADVFAGVVPEGTPTADADDVFGWPLTDGTTSSLFMAAGRRVYLNGKIQNVYQPAATPESVAVRSNLAEEAQPWVGLYWTADVAPNRESAAFYFWFDKKNTTVGTEPSTAYARANGMSVRCVKE
ncbi:MAG: hypothetical protein NC250_00175 [Alistipes senegalensis]|nr:hypothetical protein [Bacteroides cellulosilyticus]MCM1351139.1 hypothetical protein [Alistipes senegalensis]